MVHKPSQIQYVPLNQYDVDTVSDPGSSSDSSKESFKSPPTPHFRKKTKTITNTIYPSGQGRVACGIRFLLPVVFFVFWITSFGGPKCTWVEKYSPANETVEYIEGVKYKGALYFTTPWRGDGSGNPSSDVDAAWRRISTDVKPISLTGVQLNQMGIVVMPTTVKLSEEDGGGYLASLEVTHHLQCLDMLRKATYREHYESFDPAFQVNNGILMNKLDTCVELIRQALMCYPDINMVPYYWVHGYKFPIPDGNTIHRCKNFDKVLDWAAQNAVNVSRVSQFPAEKTEDGVIIAV